MLTVYSIKSIQKRLSNLPLGSPAGIKKKESVILKFADLHLHTMFSDGTYTPEELIIKTKKAGLSAISVVDHDTVSGVEQVIEGAAKEDIEVLPGIELSAEHHGLEVHILGYLINYKDNDFNKRLESLRQIRVERIYKIVAKLNELGIGLSADSVFELAKGSTVGRLHVARAMLEGGFIRSLAEAFQKYIGDKSPAYVAGFKFSPAQAIELIKSVGGVPVLAHPYTLKNDELLNEIISSGIMGLEVYYPEHSQSMVNFYLEVAKKHHLLVTGGSDCHGKAKPEVKIGSIKIPYELVEKIKDAQRALR